MKNILLSALVLVPTFAYANDFGLVNVVLKPPQVALARTPDQNSKNTSLDTSPDNAKKQAEYFQRGLYMMSAHRYAEAISNYTEALRIAPTARTLLNRAVAYNLSGNPDAAIQDLTSAVRLAPKEWIAYSYRGDIYASQKKIDLAIADYTKIIEIKPDNATVYKARAVLLINSGKPDAAIEDLTEAIRLTPGDERLYCLRAIAFAALNRDQSALMDYATTLRIHPDFAAVYSSRSLTLEREGRFVDAVQDLTDYLRLSPDDAHAYSQRADDLVVLGKDEAARKDYATAEDLDPDLAALFYGRGGSEFDYGEFSASISDLGRYLQLGSVQNNDIRDKQNSYAVIWRYLAALRSNSDGTSMLLADVGQLDKKKWPYPIVAYFLGSLSESQLWAATRSTDPQIRLNRTCEIHTYLGEIKIARGQVAQAKVNFEHALKECPVSFTETTLSKRELDRLSQLPNRL